MSDVLSEHEVWNVGVNPIAAGLVMCQKLGQRSADEIEKSCELSTVGLRDFALKQRCLSAEQLTAARERFEIEIRISDSMTGESERRAYIAS